MICRQSLLTTRGNPAILRVSTLMSITTRISSHGIELPMEAIAGLCEKHGVRELSVFGSILRGDFGPASDVDFLVVFHDEDLGPWMEKLSRMEGELTIILGRKADLIPKESVLTSENWLRRNHIVETAQVIDRGSNLVAAP
jgi:predicted nucleotidyltransferase